MTSKRRPVKSAKPPPAAGITSCPACGIVVPKDKFIEHLQGCANNRRSGI